MNFLPSFKLPAEWSTLHLPAQSFSQARRSLGLHPSANSCFVLECGPLATAHIFLAPHCLRISIQSYCFRVYCFHARLRLCLLSLALVYWTSLFGCLEGLRPNTIVHFLLPVFPISMRRYPRETPLDILNF